MDSFLFAVGAVAPIILTVAVGYLLKRIGILPVGVAGALNKLVFRVLLPCMLFLNVYGIKDTGELQIGYILFAMGVTTLVFFAVLPLSGLFTKERARRGVIAQCAFRSNYALIGIPLVESVCGATGVASATLLSAFSIPLYNILAVIALSLFGNGGKRPSVKSVLLGIVKNPLILAVGAGLLTLLVRAGFVAWDIGFRLSDIAPLYKVLTYFSSAATPMALLALGAQFEFSAIRGMRREIIAGVVARTVVMPLIGLGAALLFCDFNAAQYAALVALFATPVAVSSAPMAQEMGGDSELAGQLVVFTTLVSAFTLFLVIYALRLLGVF